MRNSVLEWELEQYVREELMEQWCGVKTDEEELLVQVPPRAIPIELLISENQGYLHLSSLLLLLVHS
jgi:hypothetical protein